MYYGPFILHDAGFGDKNNLALLINTVPLSVVSFIGGLTAIQVSEKKGRRASMLMALPFIGLSMVCLSVSMFFVYVLNWKVVGGWGSMCSLFLFLFCFQMGISG